MARPSKSHHFTIYEDAGIPTPESEREQSFDEDYIKEKESGHRQHVTQTHTQEEEPEEDEELISPGTAAEVPHDLDDADTGRRTSALTHASISSCPEDETPPIPTHQPYTPPLIRPSFRRPESVQRRMLMASPPPNPSRRQSGSRQTRSRAGTPTSVPLSPRSKSLRQRQTSLLTSSNRILYPLVLLHITLLPVHLPWSTSTLQSLLPTSVYERLQLLKSKVSETILQRGILIPHPRAEYEVLEGRLLEALGLREGRVSKGGHFRRSCDSTGSSDSGRDSDSGLGSSDDGELCAICHSHIHFTSSPTPHSASVGESGTLSKWTIKVFAANGLMGPSAWSSAWDEMERVDVEILPFISEDLRRKLDERREEEEEEETERQTEEEEDQETRLRRIVVEELWREREEMGRGRSRSPRRRTSRQDDGERGMGMAVVPLLKPSPSPSLQVSRTDASHSTITGKREDPPLIYRSSQIPLSVLLRNYIYLLAQDGRNVVVFVLVLAVVVLLFAVRSASTPRLMALSPLHAADGVKVSVMDIAFPGPIEQVHMEEVEWMGAEMPEPLAIYKHVADMLPESNAGLASDKTIHSASNGRSVVESKFEIVEEGEPMARDPARTLQEETLELVEEMAGD